MQFNKIRFYNPLFTAFVAAFFCVDLVHAFSPPPPSDPPAPILIGISVIGVAEMDEETSTQYVCIGKYSDDTTAEISAFWSVNSPFASIDSSGLLTAVPVTSDEAVVITAAYGGYSASKNLMVMHIPPSLSGLTISGPATLDANSSGQYGCVANYSDGSTLSVTPVWSVVSSIASIDAAGQLSVGNVDANQAITVKASYEGITSDLIVSVEYIAPVVLSGLTITGAVAMDEETSVQLSCVASYSDGSTAVIVPAWSENSPVASISGTGRLSAGNVTSDQSVVVTASFGSVSDTHTVLIRYVQPTLTGITVSGPSTVNENSSGQYSCTANYSDGTSEAVTPSWSEGSVYATMSAAGLLVTEDVQADQTLTVTANYQGKSDVMQVTIRYEQPTLVSLSISGFSSVDEGTSAQYSCTAAYSDGTSKGVAAVWSVDSESAQINASGRLDALDVIQDEMVTVSAAFGGQVDTFSVMVRYVAPPVTVTGLSISGPTEVRELETISLTCRASYSDGSTKSVTPVWTEDSPLADIDVAGNLVAGNFESNAVVQVTAVFEGVLADYTVSVWSVGTQVIYPLTGFAGKTVKAELYDHETDEWYDLGPLDSPEELVIENVNPDQWYWISVQESNITSGVWDEIHAEWVNM